MSEWMQVMALAAAFGAFLGFMIGVWPLMLDWAERTGRERQWARMTEEQRAEARRFSRNIRGEER
jgi:hypothetical protein